MALPHSHQHFPVSTMRAGGVQLYPLTGSNDTGGFTRRFRDGSSTCLSGTDQNGSIAYCLPHCGGPLPDGGTTPDNRRLVLRASLSHERATLHRLVLSSLATVATAKSQVCTPPISAHSRSAGRRGQKTTPHADSSCVRCWNQLGSIIHRIAGTSPLPV